MRYQHSSYWPDPRSDRAFLDSKFRTLTEYADDFWDYLAGEAPTLCLEQSQVIQAFSNSIVYFKAIKQSAAARLKQELELRGTLDEKDAQRTIGAVLKEWDRRIEEGESTIAPPARIASSLAQRYRQAIAVAIQAVFTGLPLTSNHEGTLKRQAVQVMIRFPDGWETPLRARVVVALRSAGRACRGFEAPQCIRSGWRAVQGCGPPFCESGDERTNFSRDAA